MSKGDLERVKKRVWRCEKCGDILAARGEDGFWSFAVGVATMGVRFGNRMMRVPCRSCRTANTWRS